MDPSTRVPSLWSLGGAGSSPISSDDRDDSRRRFSLRYGPALKFRRAPGKLRVRSRLYSYPGRSAALTPTTTSEALEALEAAAENS